METNKEQQPKYPAYKFTPRPWSVESHLYHYDGEKTTYLLSKLDFLEACKCVNAMEGIEDPEEWVLVSKAIRKTMELNALQTDNTNPYKTACEGINPDNPMAVAEKLAEIFNLIKKKAQIISYELSGEPSEENASCAKVLADEIEELLTKLQSK